LNAAIIQSGSEPFNIEILKRWHNLLQRWSYK